MSSAGLPIAGIPRRSLIRHDETAAALNSSISKILSSRYAMSSQSITSSRDSIAGHILIAASHVRQTSSVSLDVVIPDPRIFVHHNSRLVQFET